ncbi:MAG TPA: peptidase S10, partial [Thermoanaerobaculia bacterium]|nr:peptidase S10 [Thermoanaerobaculia bacterium]
MRKARSLLPILVLALLAVPVHAQEKEKAPAPDEKTAKPPEEKVSTTRHTIMLDGQKIAYTANAGNMVLKDEEGKAKASVFYVAYTKDGVKDPGDRPVTFSFNGGPGAASLWVHLGAFGPRRVERTGEGMGLPPPGRLVDNEHSLLDVTDLVFIDPVSTGYSRPAPGEDPKQFHGVRQDVEWVAEFIRLWVTRNERWASPKLLAGESYGTTRAAGLAQFLAERYGMTLNGVILISSVLNWQNQEFNVGNDMPYILHLPTYAATAWYHKKLPPELQGDLRKTLDEVEAFARGEYALALLQGDRLAPEKRREIAARVARYTGLSPEYVERSNLRIEISRFTKELLRAEGKTVGRLDTRFTGSDLDSVGEEPEYDPASASTDGPYVAMVNDYLRRELGYKEDRTYERLAMVWPWSWAGFENKYVNLAEALRKAMTRNPDLQVLFTCGYYDLATPYFDSVYTVDHLGLAESLRGHVKLAYYESGHMMYIREVDHAKLKKDVADF